MTNKDEGLLLTGIGGKDTQKAIDDLEKHKLSSLFSYRWAYFTGAQAQLAKAQTHYTALMEKEYDRGRSDERERLIKEIETKFGDRMGRIAGISQASWQALKGEGGSLRYDTISEKRN